MLPTVEPTADGLRVKIHNAKGEYLATGFVYPDEPASLVVDGQCYSTTLAVTWEWSL